MAGVEVGVEREEGGVSYEMKSCALRVSQRSGAQERGLGLGTESWTGSRNTVYIESHVSASLCLALTLSTA